MTNDSSFEELFIISIFIHHKFNFRKQERNVSIILDFLKILHLLSYPNEILFFFFLTFCGYKT